MKIKLLTYNLWFNGFNLYMTDAWKFLELIKKVHVGEHWNAVILHLIWFKQSLQKIKSRIFLTVSIFKAHNESDSLDTKIYMLVPWPSQLSAFLIICSYSELNFSGGINMFININEFLKYSALDRKSVV